MDSSGQHPPDPEVPLGDAAIATEIANAAARGRGADRAPTLDQLLAAFGEPAPTDAARRRVAAALHVVGMGVRPDVVSAEPGQRLLLLPPGAGSRRSRGRALAGLLAVAAILAAAAAGATVLNTSGDTNDRVADNLPETTTTTTTSPGTPSATTSTNGVSEPEVQTTATDATATTDTTATETTATTPDTSAADAAAARRRREQAAAAKAKQRQATASAGTGVTVRVDASVRPTFLCVDNAHGTVLFSGTLTGKKVFRAKRVRMNIGLASTRITVNGVPVRLDGSPAGLDITRKGGARNLALGQRPCG
jgi:hypothetical protein